MAIKFINLVTPLVHDSKVGHFHEIASCGGGAEELAVSAGTKDYEFKTVRGRSRMGFSRWSAEGATFNTSSRLNNQDLNKKYFDAD